jgi:two-component system, chemotaxis family, sensor kinase CheA
VNFLDDARAELLGQFLQTARERIETVSLDWMELERNPTHGELAEEILRELHTLKGDSKMMGLAEISLLTHKVEDLVLLARDRGLASDEGGWELVLTAADALKTMLDDVERAAPPSFDVRALVGRIDLRLAGASSDRGPASALMPHADADQGVAHPVRLEDPSRVAAPAGEAAAARPRGPQDVLRVDAAMVGGLSEIGGELVIAHNRYAHAHRGISDRLIQLGHLLAAAAAKPADFDLQRGELLAHLDELERSQRALGELVHEGGRLARQLDGRVQGLRLVPVRTLLSHFARAVRDLSREHGKQVAIELADAEATLDKRILDALSEPLSHLIRNAVDHGIELPEERVRAGKPAQGKITLAAHQDDGEITVFVDDDGRGVDPKAIERRARQLGVLPADAPSPGPEAALELLFRSGFSTRTKATDTSGRGIGLDVVKRRIEALGGVVLLRSVPGRGTRFELRLPASVALVQVLLVDCGGVRYALPGAAIEAVLAGSGEAERVHDERAIRHRGELVLLRDLGAVLGHRVASDGPGAGSTRTIVVGRGASRCAFVVGEVMATLDVVLKPLERPLDDLPVVAGASVLPDGELVLVLNPAQLVTLALHAAAAPVAMPELVQAEREARILLVDDSALTRTMVARILRTMGYDVDEAEDGAEALRRLAARGCDLLLTDIDMPRMDGIELVRRVRANTTTSTLPIVVLSTRGAENDKLRALGAGADAYLVKTDFSEAELRTALKRRLGR